MSTKIKRESKNTWSVHYPDQTTQVIQAHSNDTPPPPNSAPLDAVIQVLKNPPLSPKGEKPTEFEPSTNSLCYPCGHKVNVFDLAHGKTP